MKKYYLETVAVALGLGLLIESVGAWMGVNHRWYDYIDGILLALVLGHITFFLHMVVWVRYDMRSSSKIACTYAVVLSIYTLANCLTAGMSTLKSPVFYGIGALIVLVTIPAVLLSIRRVDAYKKALMAFQKRRNRRSDV